MITVGSGDDLKKRMWLAYPIVTAVFIFFSLNYVLNNLQQWTRLQNQQAKVAEQEEKAAKLNLKLAALRSIDREQVNGDLKKMLQALPPARRVWLLSTAVRGATANASGAALIKYQGEGGDAREATESAVILSEEEMSLTVTMAIPSLNHLQQILAYLDKSLPLVKVAGIEYEPTETKLVLVGGWKAWQKINSDSLSELPDFSATLAEAKDRLSGFDPIVDENAGDGSGEYAASPF